MPIFREEKGTPALADSYLTVIKNSVGSNLFRNFYMQSNGARTDVLRDGDLSCAFYVSAILKLFELIEEVHSEVDATVEDLERSGWSEIAEPQPGSVLVWESKQGDSGEWHRHVGFYIGDKQAVNNSPEQRVPVVSHWTFEGKRTAEQIYWRDDLASVNADR